MRVGVIGGGQLARMMIPAAIELGVELRVLAEAEGMPLLGFATVCCALLLYLRPEAISGLVRQIKS